MIDFIDRVIRKVNLIDVIDHIMHTTPQPLPAYTPLSREHDVWVAHAQVERMQTTLIALDTAVGVAEARLRARGVWLP